MNFTKSLVAASAILLAATFASAQTAPLVSCDQSDLTCSNGGKIEPQITIDNAAFMDLFPIDWGATGREWIRKTSATTPAQDPQRIGTILIQTNMPRFDVTVKSPNAGLMKNDQGTNLKAVSGTTSADVKIQLYTCLGDASATETTPCTTPPTAATTTSTGKVAALTAAGVSIATAHGKTTGFVQSDLKLTSVNATKNTGTAAIAPGDPGNELGTDPIPAVPTKTAGALYIGVYAALFTGTTTAVGGEDLIGNGTFKENLQFTLISKY